jgi:hypothetical protein
MDGQAYLDLVPIDTYTILTDKSWQYSFFSAILENLGLVTSPQVVLRPHKTED